jgi:hypothetical protein
VVSPPDATRIALRKTRLFLDRINPAISTVMPNPANRERYEADHAAFRALYENNRELTRRS